VPGAREPVPFVDLTGFIDVRWGLRSYPGEVPGEDKVRLDHALVPGEKVAQLRIGRKTASIRPPTGEEQEVVPRPQQAGEQRDLAAVFGQAQRTVRGAMARRRAAAERPVCPTQILVYDWAPRVLDAEL
jgi:hypothetical protein